MRDRANQNPAPREQPLLDAADVGRRGVMPPSCIGRVGQYGHHRLLQQLLEQPERHQTHGQAKREQAQCHMGFGTRWTPGHQESEIGNHAADDGRRQ
jgi:hypothetical protein